MGRVYNPSNLGPITQPLNLKQIKAVAINDLVLCEGGTEVLTTGTLKTLSLHHLPHLLFHWAQY